MATVTVKEQAHIIYNRRSWQSSIEVDGTLVKFRYVDDWDGAEFYVVRDGSYRQLDKEDMTEAELMAYDICSMYGIEELGSVGETFQFPDED